MKLINSSKKVILATDLKLVESFLDRVLGLLNPSNSRSLLFKTRFGIHTFFLKEPIDIIVLDNKYKAAKIKKNLKPFRLFFWNLRFQLVIELPKNVLIQTKTHVGDELIVE